MKNEGMNFIRKLEENKGHRWVQHDTTTAS
jgi:hypothetical protein